MRNVTLGWNGLTFKWFCRCQQIFHKVIVEEVHFQVKFISEACHLDFKNVFQKVLRRKSCYEISTKYRSGGGVCIFEIARIYLFTTASKIHISVFTKVTNENTESTIKPFIQVISSTRKRLSCHRLLHFLPLSLKTLVAF